MPEPVQSLLTRRTLLAIAILMLVFIVVLHLENRPWWCDEGPGFWSAAWSRCTSQHLFDPYALTHLLHGIVFYWLVYPVAAKLAAPWRLVAALALEIGWEILENSPWVVARYRQETAALDYTGDSIVNALGDVVATVLGFTLASQVSWKISLAVFLVVELCLLYFIHDNLTLNLFMLFFPLESLKEWQLDAA